jgi:hypothetical protein
LADQPRGYGDVLGDDKSGGVGSLYDFDQRVQQT